jgi:hypothetical protein
MSPWALFPLLTPVSKLPRRLSVTICRSWLIKYVINVAVLAVVGFEKAQVLRVQPVHL